MEDKRQVMFAIIRHNYKLLRGLVRINSNERYFKDSVQIVNSALNKNFLAVNNLDNVKDFKYYLDEKSMFKFFVMQNDFITKLLMDREHHLENFIGDCKQLLQDYKYDNAFCQYQTSNGLDYSKVAEDSPYLPFNVNSAPRLKELNKEQYDSIDDMERVDTLVSLTMDCYSIYNKKNEPLRLKEYTEHINLGEYRDKVIDIVEALENISNEKSEDNNIQVDNHTTTKRKPKQTAVIKSDNGYYYEQDSNQGLLFYE